jgi:hypothetical protein
VLRRWQLPVGLVQRVVSPSDQRERHADRRGHDVRLKPESAVENFLHTQNEQWASNVTPPFRGAGRQLRQAERRKPPGSGSRALSEARHVVVGHLARRRALCRHTEQPNVKRSRLPPLGRGNAVRVVQIWPAGSVQGPFPKPPRMERFIHCFGRVRASIRAAA